MKNYILKLIIAIHSVWFLSTKYPEVIILLLLYQNGRYGLRSFDKASKLEGIFGRLYDSPESATKSDLSGREELTGKEGR